MNLPALIAAAVALSAASPIVYIIDYADSKAIGRPMANAAAGISVQELNSFRKAENPSLTPSDYCYLETMRRDALVSPIRSEQQLIDRLLADSPDASFDTNTKVGVRLTVAIFEKCHVSATDEKATGSVLLATRNGKLVWADEHDGALPLYLLPPRGNELVRLGWCLACGAISELYYDPTNDKFYSKYIGD